MLKLLERNIVETNNTGVTGQFLPPKTDFEHVSTQFRLRILGHDRHTNNIYIYHAKSRLNTTVWGSLRSPNYDNKISLHFVFTMFVTLLLHVSNLAR